MSTLAHNAAHTKTHASSNYDTEVHCAARRCIIIIYLSSIIWWILLNIRGGGVCDVYSRHGDRDLCERVFLAHQMRDGWHGVSGACEWEHQAGRWSFSILYIFRVIPFDATIMESRCVGGCLCELVNLANVRQLCRWSAESQPMGGFVERSWPKLVICYQFGMASLFQFKTQITHFIYSSC